MMEKMIETRRLVIRKFREDDAQALYENHLEDQVRKWFPNECYADLAEAQDAMLADFTKTKAEDGTVQLDSTKYYRDVEIVFRGKDYDKYTVNFYAQ